MNTQNQKVILSKLLPVLFGFYVMGFVDIVGAAKGYVKQDFNLSDITANILPTMIFVWFFIMSIPTGIIQDKIGRRKTSSIGIGLTALGMFIPLAYYSFPTVLIGFVLLGIGNTIVQVSLNPLMMFVTPASKFTGFLSLSQSIKAIASLLGPIITAGLATLTGNWKFVLLVYGIISLISMIWLSFVNIEETPQKEIRATFKTSFKLLFSERFVVYMVLGIFLAVGLDVGMNICIPDFMGKRFNLPLNTATVAISLYFIARMTGTFIGSILLSKVSNKKFFIWTVLLTLFALGGMYMSTSEIYVKVMIFLVGLGAANIFPIIFSITVQRMPERSNELSGLMIMAVSGGAVIPPIMGIVVGSFGTNGNILILAVCALYLFVLALMTAGKKKLTETVSY
jgi:MFS transporter, FHS family, L-fucose permease